MNCTFKLHVLIICKIMIILSILLTHKPREKGEGLRHRNNIGRLIYSALISRQVSIYWLGFYVLILFPLLSA